MGFLNDSFKARALRYFDDMPTTSGDDFFGKFGPGNTIRVANMSYERYRVYEELLFLLRERNQGKYEEIHKGTAFSFLSWLAFDLKNFEKALYYLDATISEDVRKYGSSWITAPSAQMLKLTTGEHFAKRTIREIRELLGQEINRFNAISGLAAFNVDDFINNFVSILIKTPQKRTIISAFYIFILKKEERLIEINLRSTEGSSIGPIISHLFEGGLVFESLLKNKYPLDDNGNPVKTLGGFFTLRSFINDFSGGVRTNAATLQEILDAITDDTFVTAFSITAKLRNTTGHNLVWDNIFNNSANYERLYNQIINALFYLIERKFIR